MSSALDASADRSPEQHLNGPSGSAISAVGLSKSFGEVHVLRDVDISLATGEVVAVIGPSGSGKSTLIRCLNLLEIPDDGEIFLAGERVWTAGDATAERRLRPIRRRVGMVFQSFNLFPTLTALENVSFPQMKSLGRSKAAADAVSRDLLTSVGMSERMHHRPDQLSGGQQQRVAIARALAMEPEVMLFDEPTSAIDPEMRIEVLRVMKDLAQQGMTMVVVTHELGFAERIADRVLFLADGAVVESGTPAEVLINPQTTRARRFIASLKADLS